MTLTLDDIQIFLNYMGHYNNNYYKIYVYEDLIACQKNKTHFTSSCTFNKIYR